MSKSEAVGKALIELADLANCASNDFHMLHLNVFGATFDAIHEVLKKYYEEAANDYDSLAELARMSEVPVPNAVGSAERIHYEGIEGNLYDCAQCIDFIDIVLVRIVSNYTGLFNILNDLNSPKAIGASNFLQGRLEYWVKELCFFNHNRKDRQE